LPFPWEYQRAGEIVTAKVSGRLVMDDPSVAVSTCVNGQGIFQSLAIGMEPFLLRGELVQILPEWSEELYPLYAYHPSRHLPPAKVRAFLDFIRQIAGGV
jgi:DNA-binding transcriptional LysR family regulator